MASTPYILTYADLIDRCQEGLGGNAGAGAMRTVRAAIQDAMRDIVAAHKSNYWVAQHRVRYDAAYSTGTVVYDHTGGTYERELTLTTGTWPTNAIYGEVTIDDVTYQVEDKKTSTVITLPANDNPGADVSSTTYQWTRRLYPFPSNFLRMLSWECENNVDINFVPPAGILAHRSVRHVAGTPEQFTIRGDENLIGSLALELSPPPSSADSLLVLYERRPRTLRIDGKQTAHFQGTISTTAGSASVTGSGTAFTSAMVGSVIRIGDDATNVPTELGGVEPYLEERVIVARSSATAITLDAEAENTQSGVKYVVADPVDVSPTLINALMACVRWHLALYRSDKNAPLLEQNYRRALVLAGEGAATMAAPRYCGDGDYNYLWRPADNPSSGD